VKRSRVQSNRQIFGVPAVLAILSAVGLIAALLGELWFDVVSWVFLAVPVLVVTRALRRRG
jgi:hypothetical protein